MKKLWKTLTVALTLSLICCLGAAAVHAETYSGDVENLYSWTVNTETGLLTISSEKNNSLNYEPAVRPAWTPYNQNIKTIHYDMPGTIGLPNSEVYRDLPNLEKMYGNFGDISWSVDYTTGVGTITGSGVLEGKDLENAQYACGYNFLSFNNFVIKKCVYSDGITEIRPRYSSYAQMDEIYLGKDIKWNEKMTSLARKSWEVSPDNKTLASWKGALYTKDYKTLLAVPTENPDVERHPNMQQENEDLTSGATGSYYWKLDLKTKTVTIGPKPMGSTQKQSVPINENVRYIVVQDGVTDPALRCSSPSPVETLTLGRDVQTVDPFNPVPNTAYIVDKENPWLATYDGALYNKDLTRLISVPRKKQTIEFPDTLKTIGQFAFARTNMPLVVIPETVTTMESYVFSEVVKTDPDNTKPTYKQNYPPCTVAIIPETITSMGSQGGGHNPGPILYLYSSGNKLAQQMITNDLKYSMDYEAYVAFAWQRAGAANAKEFYERQRAGLGPRKLSGMTYIDERRWAYYEADGNPMRGGEVKLPDGQVVHFYDNTLPMNYFDQNDPKMHWYKKGNNWFYGNEVQDPLFSQWIKTGNTWYYVDRTGARCTNGWIYGRDKKWYYVGPDGAMYTSRWLWYNNHWFYLNDSGAMAVNTWIYGKDHKWYYVNQDGVMATNRWIYGKDHYWYYVSKNGVMLTNTWTPDGHYVNGSGIRVR